MKLLKSMPKDTAFFERYADLTHSLTKVATIAQTVTGAAEIGILYAILYPSVHETVSIFLSWKGSKDIATFAAAPPIERTTTAQDSAKNAATVAANSRFTTDSATIETKYKGKSEALTAEFQSRINAAESKASQANATAPQWSKSLRQNAAALRGELTAKLAAMQADKATEIQAKSDLRAVTIDHETNRANSQTDEILSENKTAKQTAKAKTDSYSGYIGYFTLFCYVFFLFTYILNEIYHKGAKIDLTPIPSQRHFTPSVLTEFVEAAKERVDVFFRTKVYNFANNTAAQPMPDAVRVLYDFKAKTFDEVLQVESDFKKMDVVKLPTKRHKIAAKLKDDSKDDTTEKRDDTSTKTRQIGFRKQDEMGVHNESRSKADLQDDKKTILVNSSDFGKCENCGKDFFRNHKIQRFCCEDCRKEAWKTKTGKDFDLTVKNKERKKK